MNKKLWIYLSSTVLVLAIAISLICYFAPKTFLKNTVAEDVSSIHVFNGSNGKSFDITDKDEIAYIVSNISSIKWHRSGISSNEDGYAFSLTFKDENGKDIESLIINNSYLIRKDPFFYNNTDSPVCYNYLIAMQNKYTGFPTDPTNTTLEFWITDSISDIDLTGYQTLHRPELIGIDKNAFFGAGYTSYLDTAGNEIFPDAYVVYATSSYPNTKADGDYITYIEITDPEVYLYGLTVNCTPEEFDQTFKSLGFEVKNLDKSDKKIERQAIKNGIVIIYTRQFTFGSFAILTDSDI